MTTDRAAQRRRATLGGVVLLLVLSERFLAELGLTEAVERLERRIADGTGNDHLIPFSEALQWAYALQVMHMEADKQRFLGVADTDPTGQTFRAMVYARGLLTHAGADVTRLTGSRPARVGITRLGGGDTLGGEGISVYWAELAALPKSEMPAYGRDVFYDRHLAGRPLVEPFGPVIEWLKALP